MIPTDTTTDTNVIPIDTTTDTNDLATDTNVIPSDTTTDTNEMRQLQTGNLGTPKQFGNLRFYGNDIELFEGLAAKLGLKPYTLLHKIVTEFIKNPQSQNPINEDIIRRDESAKYAERTEILMKTFIPIVVHQKEITELTDFYESKLNATSHNLEKTVKELTNLKNSEEFELLVNNLESVKICIPFLKELILESNGVPPSSYIAFYNTLRNRYRELKGTLIEKRETDSAALIKQLKEGFNQIVIETINMHVEYPFVSGDGMYQIAIEKILKL